MINKIARYFTYIIKFASSPDKMKLFSELSTEIKQKGLSHGIKSFLHKKMNAKGNVFLSDYTIEPYQIKRFEPGTRITLPGVVKPKVSVIIPMYNQVGLTVDCVYSIFLNAGIDSYEIIIADDNSPDDASVLKNSFENLRIIRNNTNLGFLKNCNNAAAQAKGEYIVLLNNDTYVLEGWLTELINVFERFDKVGVAGSKLVYPDGHLQEAGGIIWNDTTAWNYGNGSSPIYYEYNYLKDVDFISGASFMIPEKLWKELGGFDEAFAPAYCEDTDLCFRVREKGYRVLYEPYSQVVHFEGATHGKNLNTGVKKYQAVNQKKLATIWATELAGKSANGENVFFERDRSSRKKHIMVVDHYLPMIDKDAGSRTISNFMHVLNDLGYMVHFLGENQNLEPRYQKYYQQQGVEVLYGTEFNFFDQSWKKYLLENLNKFDAFLLSRSSVCTPMLTFLRSVDYKGVIMYYGHDLGFLRLEKEAAVSGNKALLKQAKTAKDAEDYMYNNADYSFVISEEESTYLRQYITKPLRYIPPYYFDVKPDQIPFDKKEGLLFVGGFNHPPNQDAMQWFLDEIYEPIHASGIKLYVVGSKMPQFIFDYQQKYPLMQIMPDATIEALDELYKHVRLSIVPLRYGAGVKGKVIEAMAKGIPVVGTTIAFEGMPKSSEYLYSGIDDATLFGRKILELYNNGSEWQQLSWFGKKYVLANFNKEVMKKAFKDIIG